MENSPADHDPLEPWEKSLQDFIRHCRSTQLIGLKVTESTQVRGAADLSAYSIDPQGDGPLRLTAHWTADSMGEPSHWLTAGDSSSEAPCTVDDDGTPDAPLARGDRLQRDLVDLHTMAHLATAVVREMALRPHTPGLTEPGSPEWEEMTDAEVADALAALNGIARLYLGGLPPELAEG